jgi:predicted lipid-binding transport protein (Tim44 family)
MPPMAAAKKLKIMLIIIIALLLIGLTIFAAIKFTDHQTGQSHAAACPVGGTDHTVVIQHDVATPDHVTAPRCDRLTIANDDATSRLVAFGLHEHHTPYDGVTERLLTQGQSLTVTLDQTGNFRFHDHLHDEVQGTFTVVSD